MSSERREYSGTEGVILLDGSMTPSTPNVNAGQMARGVLRGVEGRIKWHYYDAATIHDYTISHHAGQWALSGIVGLSDAFKLSQRPLAFVVPHAKGQWRLPILTFDIVERRLTASLGAPE